VKDNFEKRILMQTDGNLSQRIDRKGFYDEKEAAMSTHSRRAKCASMAACSREVVGNLGRGTPAKKDAATTAA
jgi:hypothetical protein